MVTSITVCSTAFGDSLVLIATTKQHLYSVSFAIWEPLHKTNYRLDLNKDQPFISLFKTTSLETNASLMATSLRKSLLMILTLEMKLLSCTFRVLNSYWNELVRAECSIVWLNPALDLDTLFYLVLPLVRKVERPTLPRLINCGIGHLTRVVLILFHISTSLPTFASS